MQEMFCSVTASWLAPGKNPDSKVVTAARLVLLLVAGSLASACTFGSSLNELNKDRPPVPRLKKLVMFEPNVQIYSISMDGRKAQTDKVTEVKAKLRSEISSRMQAAGYQVVDFEPREANEKRNEEQLVKLRYAIANTKMLHVLPPVSFVDKPPFSLPTVGRNTTFSSPAPATEITPDIVERYGTKYGIIVNAYDEQTTGGVKTAQFFAVLLAGGQALSPTFYVASFSIIDLQSGKEIWSYAEQSTARDLTDDNGLAETLNAAFKDLHNAQNKRMPGLES